MKLSSSVTFTLKQGEYDLRGYEVVRTQFFTFVAIVALSISARGIRFSSACVSRFTNAEYIELLVHPDSQLIAVRPCSKYCKHAIRWAKICDKRTKVRVISGGAFINTLFDLFGWDIKMRYRLRGQIVLFERESVAIFDVRKPEIFISRYDMQMPWASTGFGDGYYAYRTSQLPDTKISDLFAEYDSEPGLQPTRPEIASENVRLLIEKFQNDRGYSFGSTDILN